MTGSGSWRSKCGLGWLSRLCRLVKPVSDPFPAHCQSVSQSDCPVSCATGQLCDMIGSNLRLLSNHGAELISMHEHSTAPHSGGSPVSQAGVWHVGHEHSAEGRIPNAPKTSQWCRPVLPVLLPGAAQAAGVASQGLRDRGCPASACMRVWHLAPTRDCACETGERENILPSSFF